MRLRNDTGKTRSSRERLRQRDRGNRSLFARIEPLELRQLLTAAPSGLVATAVGPGEIDLTWVDNSTNETGFAIDRATDSSFTSDVNTFFVDADATAYVDIDTGVTAGVAYFYRVRATNDGDDSDPSDPAVATGMLNESFVVTPAGDAPVYDGTWAATNFGTSATLAAQASTSPTGSAASYLKFDLTGISGTPSDIKLRLYGSVPSGGSISLAVFPVTDNTWSDTTITWNARPTPETAAAATTSLSGSSAAWYEWDVKDFVQSQLVFGERYASMAIVPTTGTSPLANFSSAEGTNPPQLSVVADQGPDAGPIAVATHDSVELSFRPVAGAVEYEILGG